MLSFRKVINSLREAGSLKEIKATFSPTHEIPKIASKYRDTPLLFSNVENYEEFLITTGIYTEKYLTGIFRKKSKKELLETILEKKGSNRGNRQHLKERPLVQKEVVRAKNLDLGDLPIPTFYPRDRGPYITSGVILSKDPEFGLNASYHRMTPISRRKFTVRVVKRDLWTYIQRAKKRRETLEAAVAVGVPPSLALAAAMSPPIDISELRIASSISKISLASAKTLDLPIPAAAELIIEGEFIPDEKTEEGPFVDITGTYDKVREQPVFKANCLTMRQDPLFHMIIPAGSEHKTLMGLPKEAEILSQVSNVSIVRDVNLTFSGCGWLDGVVAIEKKHEDEAINAGMAAFTGHPSLKRAIIVDPDIDVNDPEEVQWAVITRAHPAKDYVVLPRAKGSSLDHTGEQPGKLIIDATIKGDPEKFKKRRIPSTQRVKKFLKE